MNSNYTIKQEKNFEKIIIKKKKKLNDYLYFVKTCKKNKFNYYKYSPSLFITCPALILSKCDYSAHDILKVKYIFNITLNQDILPYNKIAIYPQKNINEPSINYDYLYEPENNETQVKKWTYLKQKLLVNSKNNIYDIENGNYIGKRKLKDLKWYIDFSEKESI